jgi:pyruvate/2-oxoglutarate dehydrogenase complex dihydrolipoamide dehydrogenase (E3) component
VAWLDNRRAMELRALPEHLLVLGGGYVGCELGQMFRRFGARVTLVDHSAHLLAREDEDVSRELEQAFAAEGIGFELGVSIERVAPGNSDGSGVALLLSDGRAVRGSHLLVATGRRPNTDDLGCEAGRVRLDAKGFVVADDRYRTSATGVFAVGDAIDQPQFTHVSWDDHRILLEVLAGRPTAGRSGRLIPYAVFTDPQVAGVGLTEREARARGIAYEVAKLPFGHVARAREVDELAGLLKILVDPGSERILGASFVGAEAGELIHVPAALMQANASARTLVVGEAVHPTFAEGIQTTLRQLGRFTET